MYTSFCTVCVDHRYAGVFGLAVAQDVVDSFHQCFDRAGFYVDEGFLVNDLDPAPVLLICNIHCCRIGLPKKG